MNDREKEIRKQLGIPVGAELTLLDLPKHVEPPKIHGWTDEQIRGKTVEDFDLMISQRELGLAQLRKTVDNERVEIDKLNDLKKRRTQLGA